MTGDMGVDPVVIAQAAGSQLGNASRPSLFKRLRAEVYDE